MAAFIVGLVMYLTLHGAIGCDLKENAILNRIGVVNGEPGKINNFPFMARYRHINGSYPRFQMTCGAAIINERFLLTSATCVIVRFQADDETDRHVVTVGTDKAGNGEDYEIEKTIIHPYFGLQMFSSLKMDFDIAVIKLKKNLTLSEKVRPIEMAKEDLDLKSGAVLTAMGFGAYPMSEKGSEKELKTVKLSYVEHKSCRAIFKKYDKPITRHMLCAGSSKRSSCYGDIGSPIIYNGTLVGITSFINRFCLYSNCVNMQGAMPGIYSRISALRRFIDGVIVSQ